MAKIVITTVTSNTDFVDIVFNGIVNKFKDSRLRKSFINSVSTLEDGKIQIDFSDGSAMELDFSSVDEIDGDTSITTNIILRDKLREMLI